MATSKVEGAPCDTVVILGAGYSYDAGIPLLSGFVDQMWEFAVRGKANGKRLSHEDAKIFNEAIKVREDLNDYHGRAAFDDRNIEDILSILSFGTFAPRRGRTNRVAAINRAIARTIELTCSVKHPGLLNPRHAEIIEEGPQMYRDFWHAIFALEAKGIRPPSIITFNYDLVLERSLLQTLVGTHYDPYGKRFPYSHVRVDHRYGLVSPPVFLMKSVPFHSDSGHTPGYMAETQTEFPPSGLLNVEILKLHGSLNFPATRAAVPAAGASNIAAAVEDPLILPPIFNKQSTDAQRGIWTTAMERLRSAKNVVIVGYSLPRTDIYMQYFLKAALGPNVDLNRIFVFDPAIARKSPAGDAMIDRYQECFSTQLRNRMCFYPEDLGAHTTSPQRTGTAEHFVHALGNSPEAVMF